ncbi:MAG TPA: patatin, partial [Saprospiraceae bacterium]|nr:patatin [Saprospiraceae bacterium]
LIPSYDIEKRKAILFTSHNATVDSKDFYVKDVARATSAAPTFFEPASISAINGTTFSLIDGGLYANNPTLCAYSEAKKMDFTTLLDNENKPSNPNATDMVIVSIGTGEIKEPYQYEDMKDAGSISWIKPIIDILMSSNSETNAYHVKKIFKEIEQKNKYFDSNCYRQFFRIDTELFKANPEMDDASEKNLYALQQEGLRYIDEHLEELDQIVNLLVEDI